MSASKEDPFVMKNSNLFGRYLVAKRRIAAGQLIFREDPLFVYSQFDATVMDKKRFTCIACYRVEDKDLATTCSHCHWEFCSLTCAESEGHRNMECQVLSSNGVRPSRKSIPYLYVLRFLLLRKKESNKWDRIMNLTSTLGNANPNYEEYLSQVTLEAKEFLNGSCKRRFSTDYIKKMIKLLKINSFSFSEENESEGELDRNFSALYETCCLLAHSCAPNAEWYLPGGGAHEGTIGIFSRRCIAAGEMVTIAYTDDQIYEGTRRRRSNLFTLFSFWCACKRCLDPTDRGTYFSALKCARCPDGVMLPPKALSFDKLYKCDICTYSLAPAQVDMVEDTFRQKVLDVTERCKEVKTKKLDDLISKATSQYKLHSTHYLVIDAIHRWLALQNFSVLYESNAKTESTFSKILERTEKSLSIANAFGRISEQVNAEYTIASVLIAYHFKSKDYLSIKMDVKDLDKKISIIQTILKHLRQGIRVRDHKLFDAETSAVVREMERRYVVWNNRLSECLSKKSLSWNA